jgi:polyisoprenoid-binding protein YceI
MAIAPGHYELGPDDAKLIVYTWKAGAASKAGHNLRIEVTSWRATIDVGEDPGDTAMALTADPRSLRVREGTGGMKALGDDDKANIEQTIDDEVLEGRGIEFRSRSVEEGSDGKLIVEGDLDLGGVTRPVEFDLVADDGRLSGSARIAQTDWGIKPYSALFGTLKVVDEVDVEIDGRLPA